MSSPKENSSTRKSKSDSSSQEVGKSLEENERRSSRVKKPKLVYDPSDKQAPYKKINLEEITKSPSKIKSNEYGSCSLNSIDGNRRNSGNAQKLSGALCVICNKKADTEPHTTCTNCSDTYHNMCHEPNIGRGVRRVGWQCATCRRRREKDETKERKSATNSRAPSRAASSVTNNELQSEEDNEFTGFNDTDIDEPKNSGVKEETNCRSNTSFGEVPQIDMEKAKQMFKTPYNNAPNSDTIPDVSSWTYNQIYDYFFKIFPKEAFIFKDQEIDGTSLLLMTRSDIFKFNLKLGPALNIFRHIVMLQTRSYDPRKTWM